MCEVHGDCGLLVQLVTKLIVNKVSVVLPNYHVHSFAFELSKGAENESGSMIHYIFISKPKDSIS